MFRGYSLALPVALLTLLLAGCDKDDDDRDPKPKAEPSAPKTPAKHTAVKLDTPHLENAHRLTDKVITGAQPEGAESFQELKDLGVKTVISVDGTRPNVELAKRYGLKYVHLPFGYDGVPPERAKELAKAVTELDGPIYIHCHHGKHRGAAAAVVACVLKGDLSNEDALATMKTMGTGENYLGLWASAREARPMDPQELKKMKVKFHETSPIPALAEAMVHIDNAFDALKDSQKAGWKTLPENPDIDPPHEALKLREIITEILRTKDFEGRPEDFKKWMKDAETQALALEKVLLERKQLKYEGVPAPEIDVAMKALGNNCAACHKPYRNSIKK